MDVIALAQFGIPYAVATLGTATSQEHIEKLFRHSEELVFCFDGDDAGRRAAWRALENALGTLKDGRQIKILLLPEGEDPDTLVRKNGKDYFEGLLEETATPLSEYFFEQLGADINLSTMDGRARIASLAKPYLEKLPSGVFQQLMLKRLSEITQLEDIQLAPPPPPPPTMDDIPPAEYLENEQPPPYYEDERPKQRKPFNKPNKGTNLSLVDSTIRMLLNAPRQATTTELPEGLDQLTLPHMEVLLELFQFLREKPGLSTASILGHWQNRPHNDVIFTLAAKEFLLPNDDQAPELEDALRKLQLQKVEQELDQIIEQGVKDKARFQELLHLQKQLSK